LGWINSLQTFDGKNSQKQLKKELRRGKAPQELKGKAGNASTKRI